MTAPQPPLLFAVLRRARVTDEADIRSRLQAQQRAEIERRVAAALRLRNIPAKPELRAVVRDPAPPRTRTFEILFRAVRWRRDRHTPAGEYPGALVILSGGVGCGKSAAACWFLARWPRTALRVSALDLAEMPDTQWGAHIELREQWACVDYLLLDDVGMERERARLTAERISALLWRRYEEGRFTVVTTNRSADAFAALYLTIWGEVVEGTTERIATPGTARMASRLSNEQLGQGGLPYFEPLHDEPDYRDPSHRAVLARMPRVAPTDLDVFAESTTPP